MTLSDASFPNGRGFPPADPDKKVEADNVGNDNTPAMGKPLPIERDEFKCISKGGFGDGWNHYGLV